MSNVIIHDPSELEFFRQEKNITYFDGDSEAENEYNSAFQKALHSFRLLLGAYELKEPYYSAKDVFMTPSLESKLKEQIELPNTVQKYTQHVLDNRELLFNLNMLEKALRPVTTEKFTNDDIDMFVENTFKILNENFECKRYDINHIKYNLLDGLLLKNEYNCYKAGTRVLYTNFFDEHNYQSNKNGNLFVNDLYPEDNKLTINCDLKLPEGSILDVYGNLEAQNIECGFLASYGNLKANDINCERLYAFSVDAHDIECIQKDTKYDDMFQEITVEDSLFITDNLDNDVLFNKETKKDNSIIVGSFSVYSEPYDNLLKYGEDAKDDSIGEININGDYYDVYIANHAEFDAGRVKAHKIITNSMVCGEIQSDTVVCDELRVASSVVNEEKSKRTVSPKNISSIELTHPEEADEGFDDGRYYYNRYSDEFNYEYEFAVAKPVFEKVYKPAQIGTLLCAKVECGKLEDNTILRVVSEGLIAGSINSKYIDSKTLTATGNIISMTIDADNITSFKNIKADTLTAKNRLAAKEVNVSKSFDYSEAEELRIESVVLGDKAMMVMSNDDTINDVISNKLVKNVVQEQANEPAKVMDTQIDFE